MASRPHDHFSQGPQDQNLLDAALSGDDFAFATALATGADVNVIHEDGRNALICVMTGQKYALLNTAFSAPSLLIALI